VSLGEDLVALQDRDLAIDRLRHRRLTLAARTELAAAEQRAADLDAGLAEAGRIVDAVAARQSALEAELAATEARLAEVNRRLYSGNVTASRELVSMSADADQLKQRRSDLEDQLLGVLEERDPLDARLTELTMERRAVDQDRIRLQSTLAEEERAIDDELVVEEEARQAQAAAFGDPTVLRTYEQLRKRMGGVGAARLVGNACNGCHLVLAAQEVDRIRRLPPDELVSCEQCGRILVR
jgi:predicted  nucleic acid-binding Zn-ribbon protein